MSKIIYLPFAVSLVEVAVEVVVVVVIEVVMEVAVGEVVVVEVSGEYCVTIMDCLFIRILMEKILKVNPT